MWSKLKKILSKKKKIENKIKFLKCSVIQLLNRKDRNLGESVDKQKERKKERKKEVADETEFISMSAWKLNEFEWDNVKANQKANVNQKEKERYCWKEEE